MEALPFSARLLYAALWLLGRLPLSALQWLGERLGTLARWFAVREARVSWRNLELCFPQMDADARARLWRWNLAETGKTALETARFWTRPAAQNLKLIRKEHGRERFDAALASGRGVIIAAPHLGNWELLNQWLAAQSGLAILYRPPRQPLLDALIRRFRAQPGVTQVRAEASGVRALFKILKDGGMLGILPDQQPKRGDGEFAPFFGIPALTMTLLPRLAERTGAVVLCAYAMRLPGHGQGFEIRIEPADDAIADADPVIATAALNAAMERCIHGAPTQYQWSYKRFTIRPEGEDPPIRY